MQNSKADSAQGKDQLTSDSPVGFEHKFNWILAGKISVIGLLVIFTGILPMGMLWLRYMFVFGLNPMAGDAMLIIIALVLLPLGFKLFKWFKKNWFTNPNQEPVILFLLGSLSLLISLAFVGNSTLDLNVHHAFMKPGGTYYVAAFWTILIFALSFFWLFAILYYLIPRISGRGLNIVLSRFHFWVSLIGLYSLFGMNHLFILDEAGTPRHYVDFKGGADFRLLQNFDRSFRMVVILMLIAQLVFFINIIFSLFRKRISKH